MLAVITPPTNVSGRLSVDCGRDAIDELDRMVEEQAGARPWLALAGQGLSQPPLGLRTDAGDVLKPSRCRCIAQLLGRAHAKRLRQADHPLCAETEVAAKTDEIRRELTLERCQLADLTRLDKFPQLGLDSRSNPAQLSRPTRPDEFSDWRGHRPDHLGGATIGAHRIRIRVTELEQHGERVE